jgi:hypothetical protein
VHLGSNPALKPLPVSPRHSPATSASRPSTSRRSARKLELASKGSPFGLEDPTEANAWRRLQLTRSTPRGPRFFEGRSEQGSEQIGPLESARVHECLPANPIPGPVLGVQAEDCT